MRPGTRTIRYATALIGGACLCTGVQAQQSGTLPPPAAPAATEEPRVLSVTASGSEVWDSNVFRLPGSAPSSSDRIASASVGLHVDKPYGQQRFLLNVAQGAVRYQNLSYLNFNPLTYDGAWSWHLTPRVSGTLSAARAQSLYRFEDSRNITQRIVSTTDNGRFSIDGWLFGGWHLVGAALYDKSSNSQQVAQTPDYRASGGEAGVRYVTRAGSSMGFNYRSNHGQYVDQPLDPVLQVDDGFDSKEWELVVDWRPGGQSSLTGRAAWYDYRAAHFSARDFSGPAGSLTYNWSPTGKLAFTISAARSLEAYWLDTSSYRVSDLFSIAPTWKVTAKTTFRVELAYVKEDYRNPAIASAGPLRSDRTRRGLIGVDWAPLRNVTVGASVQRESRHSNFDTFEYGDTLTTVNAALRF
jgi:exopolysaccharide biosynthesis operon protein EpsL